MDGDDFHGCKVALFFGDRLLAHLRDHSPGIAYPGHWDLPGGGREGAETPEETLARELEEEFGLEWSRATELWRVRSPAVHQPDAHVWFFVARMAEAEVANILFGDEGDGWALMPLGRFLSLDRVVPSHAPRLRAWRAETGG